MRNWDVPSICEEYPKDILKVFVIYLVYTKDMFSKSSYAWYKPSLFGLRSERTEICLVYAMPVWFKNGICLCKNTSKMTQDYFRHFGTSLAYLPMYNTCELVGDSRESWYPVSYHDSLESPTRSQLKFIGDYTRDRPSLFFLDLDILEVFIGQV